MKIALRDPATRFAAMLSGKLGDGYEICEPSGDVDVLVSRGFSPAEASTIRFSLLQVTGAGVDAVDFAAVPPGSWVCNVYEHETAIAEYVMLAMLESEIGLSAMARDFSPATWPDTYRARTVHGELSGKTVGLLGFGRIATEVAARARAFGMRVIAISRTTPDTPLAEWSGDQTRLDAMLAESDYVVISCPLSDATRGLIDARRLAVMKPTGVLINVARAEIADEEALFHALRDRTIGGAVLDVWYAYPAGDAGVAPSRFPFETLPNVACTPHSSGLSDRLWDRRFTKIAENIRRFAAGQTPYNVVRAPGSNP